MPQAALDCQFMYLVSTLTGSNIALVKKRERTVRMAKIIGVVLFLFACIQALQFLTILGGLGPANSLSSKPIWGFLFLFIPIVGGLFSLMGAGAIWGFNEKHQSRLGVEIGLICGCILLSVLSFWAGLEVTADLYKIG